MIVVVKIPTGGVAGVHDCRAHSPRRECWGHCHILSYSTDCWRLTGRPSEPQSLRKKGMGEEWKYSIT
jgi:hypothetical protein